MLTIAKNYNFLQGLMSAAIDCHFNFIHGQIWFTLEMSFEKIDPKKKDNDDVSATTTRLSCIFSRISFLKKKAF